jgi:hypothetical protein
MTFPFLTNVTKVVDWARQLVTAMNRRDAEIERRLSALEKPPS